MSKGVRLKHQLPLKKIKNSIVAAAFAAILSSSAIADENVVAVDIYSTFDINNAPTAGPYSGYAGHYYLTAADLENGYNFGEPFGLSQFVAVLTFTEYVSVTGLYIPFINTDNGWTANLYDANYGPHGNGPGPYALGAYGNEILLHAGFNQFEIDYIAGVGLPDGSLGSVGGPPYLLTFDFPSPWGGDESVWGAQTYLVPVPDAGSTFSLLGGALACLAMLRRRFVR